MMSKIGSDHLARAAIVYIRQSTADQVAHNLESKRRQYALVELCPAYTRRTTSMRISPLLVGN